MIATQTLDEERFKSRRNIFLIIAMALLIAIGSCSDSNAASKQRTKTKRIVKKNIVKKNKKVVVRKAPIQKKTIVLRKQKVVVPQTRRVVVNKTYVNHNTYDDYDYGYQRQYYQPQRLYVSPMMTHTSMMMWIKFMSIAIAAIILFFIIGVIRSKK